MQPVIAIKRRQPQIGQNKPLRCTGIIVQRYALDPCGQGKHAGVLAGQNIAQRQAGCHCLVQFVDDFAGAFPDILADLIGKFRYFIFAQGAPEEVLLNGAQQVAITDAAQLQIDLIQIDSFNRQGGTSRLWQHIGAPSKADLGRAVTDIKRDIHIFDQGLATGGGQAFAEGHAVALPVLGAVNADLITFGLHHHACIGQAHIGRVIGAGLDQRFREFCTDTRAGHFIVATVLGDTKAVFCNGCV